MAPDGSDPRVDLEEPDFPASTPAGFSWAPDGKSVALIRTLSSGSQELFIHGFESGVESQLTSDDAHIGGVCWTKDNNIIYSSSKDGNANIWIVPAEGGIPVKLSGGIGPDVAMNISGDGNAMLILRRRQLGVVSTADSNGAVTGHIPVNNLDIRSVSISPDGGRLAFQALEPDPLKPVPHLYLSGRDGADLRTVSPGNDIAGEPRWSPDGRWIAYCARSISEPVDSERAYLVSTTQSGSPKSLGPAHAVWWLDSANVVLHSGTNSWKLGISGGDRTRFYNDSAFAIPMSDGITLLFRDLRRGREGWWIDSLPLPPASGTHADSLRTVAELTPSSADSIKSSGRSAGDSAVRSASQAHSVPDTLHLRIDSARIASNDSSAGIHAMPATTPHFLHSDPWQFALCYRDRYILYRSESGEIWKRSLSGGSEQRLPAKYPDHGITMAVSPDGTEILYVETQRTSQLILMENLR
jgi:Tol biopolymer transport system component